MEAVVDETVAGLEAGWMREALRLAAEGRCSTAPNPRVGCVLVRNGLVVGRGFHARAGEPHAEVLALREAGASARGATAYVTLEPCSHHGRTPPCAAALVAAGVARVVYAVGDPNPQVDGRGAAWLRAAGIEVLAGVEAAAATELNRGFLRRVAGGRPWVRAKVAASLDGRTALADGTSQWITGPAARADVQRLRAEACVVVTGIGTALADDPQLTVRDPRWLAALRGRPVRRAVVDPAGRLPAGARLRDGAAPTWWLVGERAPAVDAVPAAGASARAVASSGQTANPCVPLERRVVAGAGRPTPEAVLALLAAAGMNEVLLEAGATLTGAWLEAGVVDELVVYYAPRVLGDAARPLAHSAPTPGGLSLPPVWQLAEAVAVGADLRVTWRRVTA